MFGSLTNFYDDSYSNGGNYSLGRDFGDNIGSSTQQNPSYFIWQLGFYNVSLTVQDVNSCRSSVTGNSFVDSLPIPDFTYSLSCSQGIVYFNNISRNGSNIVGYLWDFDDMSMSGQVNPAHFF